ncbi:MAG: hypothetical protein WDN01_02790 [Rhizomicrobium sp.]
MLFKRGSKNIANKIGCETLVRHVSQHIEHHVDDVGTEFGRDHGLDHQTGAERDVAMRRDRQKTVLAVHHGNPKNDIDMKKLVRAPEFAVRRPAPKQAVEVGPPDRRNAIASRLRLADLQQIILRHPNRGIRQRQGAFGAPNATRHSPIEDGQGLDAGKVLHHGKWCILPHYRCQGIPTMKRISLIRFDALAGYARRAAIRFMIDELAWFEHADGRVLGMVFRDRTDDDYGGMAFGKDRKGRYRWIGAAEDYYRSQRHAEAHLRREIERLAHQSDEEFFQGDEAGTPIDFFQRLAPETKLNPGFRALRDDEGYSAARGIIEPMMRWYEDADGNFIEQFQTSGFDARIWELYLFAAFTEMGYDIERKHAAPDLYCRNPLAEFFIEAVTVNPSRDPSGQPIDIMPKDAGPDFDDYLRNYMPIRFAGSLTTKLAKRYWELPHVKGKPLLFAIQDFSGPRSMTFTRSAFESYVTGYRHTYEKAADGTLKIVTEKIGQHVWKAKTVASGFFTLPGTENVSAVLFSNAGTIAKFNRMGTLAGFGSRRVRIHRVGTAVNHDPQATTPVAFRHDVNAPDYFESWAEGIDIWHNPNAKQPLHPGQFPGAAHHRLRPDGQVKSTTPEWHPLGSTTLHFVPQDGV